MARRPRPARPAAEAQARPGVLTADPMAFTLPQGQLGGSVKLDARKATPVAAILPFVDPGLAKDANCAGLIAEANRHGARSRRRRLFGPHRADLAARAVDGPPDAPAISRLRRSGGEAWGCGSA